MWYQKPDKGDDFYLYSEFIVLSKIICYYIMLEKYFIDKKDNLFVRWKYRIRTYG